MVDLLEVVISEGVDVESRAELAKNLEQAGHETRAELDPAYKRATWGRRPEDVQQQQAVISDLAGKRAK